MRKSNPFKETAETGRVVLDLGDGSVLDTEEVLGVAGAAAAGIADQKVATERTRTDATFVPVTDGRLPVQTDDYAHAWGDSSDRVALGVRNDGTTEIQGGTIGFTPDEGGYAYAWADSGDRVALGVRSDGTVEIEGQPYVRGVAPAVRKSPIVLTLSGGGGATGEDTREAVHARYPFSPGADVTIRAIHIRNYNDRSSLAYSGSLSFTGVWIGPHKVDHTGLTGEFTAAPTQVSGAFTTGSAGQEYVISGLDLKVPKGSEYLLSFGYTSPAGQKNHRGIGGSWTTTTPADASVLAPAGMTRNTFGPLDVWIEVEHTAPVTAWIGDSIWCGVGNTTPVYTAPGALHARANGHIPMLFCHSGSQMVSWTGGNTLWKYAKWANMSRPDVVVWELGRNDLIDAGDLATMRARFDALYPRVADYISRNIYMTTITPKSDDETSADGILRRAWNDVIRNELQGGAIRMAFETAKAVERPGGTNIDTAVDADGLHFKTAGSVRLAQSINQQLV